MLKVLPDRLEVEKIWRRKGTDEKNTDSLHSIISTPILSGGYIYGVDSYGELRCLDANTGDRIWEDLTAVPKARWGTIHFVQNADKVWMFNERGELLITTLSPEGLNIISRAKLIERPATNSTAEAVSAGRIPPSPTNMFSLEMTRNWSAPRWKSSSILV